MAQTKRKRRSKHRGTAVGTIESRGRTGRKPAPSEKRASTRDQARQRRAERFDRPPSWRSVAIRSVLFALASIPIFAIVGENLPTAIVQGVLIFFLLVPLGYYTDLMIYRRRMRKRSG